MQIRKSAILFTFAVAVLLLFATTIIAESSEIADAYIAAYDSNDQEAILKVVADNEEKVPAEIKALIYSTMGANVETQKKESTLYVAEQMAITYKEVTGDFEPLRGVKKEQFESKISEAVVSVAKDGVHVIETPMKTKDGRFNFFSPDNMTIKKGETVRWQNTDHIAHLFASFSIIGKGGLFTPNIDPGASWEYTFEESGEYYYLCFIHKGMLGKITVEE